VCVKLPELGGIAPSVATKNASIDGPASSTTGASVG
jgi:hypothetical protein